MAATQFELEHYPLSISLGAVLAVGSLVVGLLASAVWLAWAVIGTVICACDAVSAQRLRRRQRQLESWATGAAISATR